MSVIYWDGEAEEIEAGTLGQLLNDITEQIIGNKICCDTEGSGLFVDGDWKKGPPARVSAVSIAWDELGHSEECWDTAGFITGHCVCQGWVTKSIALPFDQGRIGGKPGRWSDELGTYETLSHTDECREFRFAQMYDAECVCAPWNLNTDDWFAVCGWLKQRLITWHNAKHDLHTMNAGLRTVPGSGVNLLAQTVRDTLLAQGILEPLASTALKSTAEQLFSEDSRREERVLTEHLKKQGAGLTKRYDLLAWDVIGPYAAKDTRLTKQLEHWQLEQVEAGQVEHTDLDLIQGEFELMGVLFNMELRRVGANIEQMRIETGKLEKASAEIRAGLPFQPVNVNSAKRYFFGSVESGGLGLVPIKVTDVCELCTYNREKGAQRKNTKKPLCTGDHRWSPSLDGEVAGRLAADKVPYADVWVQLAQIDSALSKWYRAWPQKAVKTPEGWRLMTNFRQCRIESERPDQKSGGAISGRLSAERIQLQGFPDDYRIPKFITPPKKLIQGKVAWCEHCEQVTQHHVTELDVSNAEVRVAAWLMKSASLARACATGNVHSANTVRMARALGLLDSFPGGWDPAWPDDKLLTDESDEPILDNEGKKQYHLTLHPEWGKNRKILKTTILGLFFGAGLKTLKAQIEKELKHDFPMSKVREFRDYTLKLIPEWQRCSRRMQQKADKTLGGVGYIRLVNGRKRWFGWAEHTHKAFNSGTQGGVAEMMKVFMRWVERNYPGVLINQVHDSCWVETCPCRTEQVVAALKAEGERLFTEAFSTPELHIPFEFDSKRLA